MSAARYSRAKALRWAFAAAGSLLLAVVLAFIAIAHGRANNWLSGLPRHLGVDIQQETNGYTYSQSSKGKKIFTVHAAREVQRTNGKIALHDVGITLFDAAQQPSDRIHGADFEYDPKAQILTAHGEVFIDLVRPPKTSAGKVEDEEARIIHVKTVGLLFDQKAQVATSDGAVEFQTNGYTGNAIGASYDSPHGVVVLRSAVRMSGLRHEKPVLLTATRAEMDRPTNVIDLASAKYVSAGEHGAESVAASHAVIHTLADGTPQHVDAEGNVTLTGDKRGTVTSSRLQMDLGPTGQARAAHLIGNVTYLDDEKATHQQGRADDARIAFDSTGKPLQAFMTGAVTFVEAGLDSTRNLEAATLDVKLAGGGKQPTIIRDAQAFGPGGAHLRMVKNNEKGRSTSDVKADRLSGKFAAQVKGSQLTALDGVGHSVVERLAQSPTGAELSKDWSTGETLHVDFVPGAQGHAILTRAEQRRGVTTFHEEPQRSGANKGQMTSERAHGDDLVYDAKANLVHLTGDVEVQDDASALFADRVDLDRGSGDATANGSVKVTYVDAPDPGKPADPSQQPLHVLAARAVSHKAAGYAEFFGTPQAKARMWQGGSQLEAPVINFYQKDKRLVAHGDPDSDAAAVRAVLVQADSANANRPQAPVRVTGRELVYTDTARTVEVKGPVRVDDADGVMTSSQATVWLTPANATAKQKAPQGFMGGSIDHMVATGAVDLTQPGRKALGDKLVYTASDGAFVLTGSRASPPRVEDQAQGTTTGAALRFKTGDDSVQVLGSLPGAASLAGKTTGRVRSETKMRQ